MRSLNMTKLVGSTGRAGLRRLTPVVMAAAQLASPLFATTQADTSRQAPTPLCVIRGIASAGQVRLPGVGITVTPQGATTGVSTSTGLDGTYTATIPGPGTYTVATDLTGFAPVTRDAVVGPSCQARQDLELTLASRVEGAVPVPAATKAAAAQPADRRPAASPFRGTVGTPAGTLGQLG